MARSYCIFSEIALCRWNKEKRWGNENKLRRGCVCRKIDLAFYGEKPVQITHRIKNTSH